MTTKKKITIIGGNLEAFAINFVLSGMGFDTTVISQHLHPKNSVDGEHDPFEFVAYGQQICEALEYFELPNSKFFYNQAALVDGELKDIGDLSGNEIRSFYEKSRGVEPPTDLDLKAVIPQRENKKTGIRFDTRSLLDEMVDFASPEFGVVRNIGANRVFFENTLGEMVESPFDYLIITAPISEWARMFFGHAPVVSQTQVIRVLSDSKKFLDVDAAYLVDTQTFYRVTRNNGAHIFEVNADRISQRRELADDLVEIFGDDQFLIDSCKLSHTDGFMVCPPQFETPENVFQLGRDATANLFANVSSVMEDAAKLFKGAIH